MCGSSYLPSFNANYTGESFALGTLILCAVLLTRTRDIKHLLATGEFCTPLYSLRVNTLYLVLTVLTDIMLIALPLHILASLRLSSPEKRGVAFILAIAFISISAAVGRFVVLNYRRVYENLRPNTAFDKHYWTIGLAMLEITATQIAFVLPALRRVVLDKKRGSQQVAAQEVMMVQIVEGDGSAEILVDRADREAAVWGFASARA
jgi:hypothetical protein